MNKNRMTDVELIIDMLERNSLEFLTYAESDAKTVSIEIDTPEENCVGMTFNKENGHLIEVYS